MALTPSSMPSLGRPAADFALPDINSNIVRRDDFSSSPALLVAFWCNHCPYVKHIRSGFVAFAKEYQARGLAVVAINANDADSYPDDNPASMRAEALAAGYCFPYLFDRSQEVARAYAAACTPDFFLYDEQRVLVYRGQFDASRPGNNIAVTGDDLRAAVDALLDGEAPTQDQVPSMGCNIKWRPAVATA